MASVSFLGLKISFDRKEFTNFVYFTVEHLIVKYRWIFVCFFLVPLSVVFDVYWKFRQWITFRLSSSPKRHLQKVRHVQQQVRDWNISGRMVPMCTSRPAWATMSFRQAKYKKSNRNINVNLVDILEIDAAHKTVKVEPMVTIGQLVSALLTRGWTLQVVPELEDLTIGGLVNGCGVETSSHKYGLFQHTCLSYEVVISDGSLVTCSADENADLFYSIPWSNGSLGFVVAVELKIIPAKPYVKLAYLPCFSLADFVETFEKESKNIDNDFVEGIMFDESKGVVMRGEMTENAEFWKVNRIGRWYKQWFYKHVESYLTRSVRDFEYIPLRDYYHRHTRSLFWEMEDIIPFGNKRWFRILFGWTVPPKVSLLKLTQTEMIRRYYERTHMIQDFLVPMLSLEQTLKIAEREIKLHPIWLCPFILPALPGMVHSPRQRDEMYVDVGLYGKPKEPKYDYHVTPRRLESYVRSIKGFQMMYADTTMSRDEFRSMFDHTLYDQMRVKYEATDAFPESYDKVCQSAK